MLDIFNIPGQQDNVKIFYAAGTTAWQTWQKPRNCKFIWMMCIGGGAGGQGGSNNQGIGFQGSNGGGGGGVVRALFPANVLPDTLYIQPGPGGTGGAVGLGTSTGNKSYVSINPSGSIPAPMNLVCTSGNAAAASLSGETIATTANAGLLSLGNFSAVAGQTAAGGDSSISPLTSTITCGGAGGGGTGAASNPGGSIGATTISPVITGGTSTTVVGGSGIVSWKPFYLLGGAGGWGAIAAGEAATKGGDGAYGCGGGGGGLSASGLGAVGGKGGDGLVIIATF